MISRSKANPLPQDVVAQEAPRARLVDGALHASDAEWILVADIDIAVAGAGGTAGDDHALNQRVGVRFHLHAVDEGAGVALVGVADHVLDGAGGALQKLPFAASGESATAAATDAGLLDKVADREWLHGQGAIQPGVGTDRERVIDRFGVDHAHPLHQAPLLTPPERMIGERRHALALILGTKGNAGMRTGRGVRREGHGPSPPAQRPAGTGVALRNDGGHELAHRIGRDRAIEHWGHARALDLDRWQGEGSARGAGRDDRAVQPASSDGSAQGGKGMVGAGGDGRGAEIDTQHRPLGIDPLALVPTGAGGGAQGGIALTHERCSAAPRQGAIGRSASEAAGGGTTCAPALTRRANRTASATLSGPITRPLTQTWGARSQVPLHCPSQRP